MGLNSQSDKSRSTRFHRLHYAPSPGEHAVHFLAGAVWLGSQLFEARKRACAASRASPQGNLLR
jgi:hypothetical protein